MFKYLKISNLTNNQPLHIGPAHGHIATLMALKNCGIWLLAQKFRNCKVFRFQKKISQHFVNILHYLLTGEKGPGQ